MLFKRKTSPNWYIVYRDGSNRLKWISTKTTNKRDAQALHDETLALVKSKKDKARIRRMLDLPEEKNIEKITLAEVWKKSIDIIPTIPPDTLKIYTTFRKWVEYNRPEVKYIHELTTAMAHDFFKKKYAKRAPKTHNTYKSALHKLFSAFAVYDIENPFSGVPNRGGGVQSQYRALSNDELRAFIAALPSEWRDFARFTYYTGLRYIDACHVLWSEINIEKGVIITVPSKTERFKRAVCIHLHPVAEKIIREKLSERDFSPYLFAEAKRTYGNNVFKRMIRETLKNIGIIDNERGKASFHSLRVTFITNCRKEGIDTKVIGGIVGHSDEKTTELYFDDMESGAVVKNLPILC